MISIALLLFIVLDPFGNLVTLNTLLRAATPVLDADDRLCGIVSLGDLARETRGDTAELALEGVTAPGGSHQQ